ncbi:sensor histidine kinase EsaS [Comamonas humi]
MKGDKASSLRAAHPSRRVRWSVMVGLAAIAALALLLLFLLSFATNNRALYERNFGWLLGVNVAVAVLLLLVVLWGAGYLLRRFLHRRFGSKLLLKLAATFALVGVAPGLVIYFVSYQFVSRSIESWFDVKVEGALDAGVSLARVTLDTTANAMADRTRTASAQLAQVSDASAGVVLERIKDQLGADDVVLWGANGQAIASTGQSRFVLNPDRPPSTLLRAAAQQQRSFQIEGLDDMTAAADAEPKARVKTLALVASNDLGLVPDARFLQATMALPPALVSNAIKVQEANREYQERALARDGLRRMYIGTLTLSLFLAVFGAIVLAVLLGNELVRPLLVLAEGVREVASGNLRPKPALHSKDELSGLTRSFAEMTQQLLDARRAVERSMRQVNEGRQSLQAIMDNLTSGVIVLDERGAILTSNPGATRILRVPMAAYEGKLLPDVQGLEVFAHEVSQQFAQLHEASSERRLDHWQRAFDLHAEPHHLHSQDSINLIARGAMLPDNRRLLVFDDISEIVSAQRAQAWGEVARRLAHEIKNPLTPIQLSAERLQMKLEAKLDEPGRAVLNKSVTTIVDQVDAMKRLVNEFRDYARLPAADLQPLDLNNLITDTLHLYGVENATVPIEADLDPTAPRVMGDAQQLRQVIHNLLQNAQDATQQAGKPDAPVAPVRISTRWGGGERVRLTIADSGSGFADPILQRAFEPYVTTKSKGTGLGLAVVKKIADEHHARIEISNRTEGEKILGAQVSLSLMAAVAA